MKTFFSSDFFAANRRELQARAKAQLIVITANGALQRNSDCTYPFRQDSSFWYLTGLEEPGALLVITEGREYIIMPERGEYLELFEGAVANTEIMNRSGLNVVLSHKEGWQSLRKDLQASDTIATLHAPEAFIETYGMYSNPARRMLRDRLEEIVPRKKHIEINKEVASLRSVKQPQELKAIRYAIKITADAFNYVREHMRDYSYEYQIDAAFTQAFMLHNAKHAYGAIVASDYNATVLHYMANNSKIKHNSLVLLDVGAEVENYAADITRVYASGRPNSRHRAVHQSVVEAQHEVLEFLKPGISIKELEVKTQTIMGKRLKHLSLLPHAKKDVRSYYPHAVSHFLGLDVHDAGDYQAPLQPGMVITVEPGIYIPEENIGVRIEDNVLITDTGYEVLSKNLSHDLA